MSVLAERGAWIFDLDGTLTVPQHDFDAIRAKLGIPAGRLILEHLDTLPAGEAAALHAQLNALEEALAAEARLADGALHLLEGLLERNCRVGILTRNTRSNALIALRAIGLHGHIDPTDVLGRDECAAKPDPAGINLLLTRWQRQPSEAVMVGDYLLDLQAGRAAGTLTVHVDLTGRQWPDYTDHYTRSLRELHHLANPAVHRC